MAQTMVNTPTPMSENNFFNSCPKAQFLVDIEELGNYLQFRKDLEESNKAVRAQIAFSNPTMANLYKAHQLLARNVEPRIWPSEVFADHSRVMALKAKLADEIRRPNCMICGEEIPCYCNLDDAPVADNVRVLAAEQARHNQEMHAINGNESSTDVLLARKRSDYQRSVSAFNSSINSTGMNGATKTALLQCLDGYHDAPYTAVGLPTGVKERIVVHDFQKALTITKPANLAAGATWDCHIVTNNVAGESDGACGFFAIYNDQSTLGCGQTYSLSGSQVSAITGSPIGMAVANAPILIHRVTAGTDTFSVAASGCTAAGLNLGVVDIPRQYLQGPCRVVGMSFEVTNVTSPLNVQGQCLVYRSPMNSLDTAINLNEQFPIGTSAWNPQGGAAAGTLANAATGMSPARGRFATAPPARLADAQRVHNSQTWHAKEGAYCNAVLEKEPEMSWPQPMFPAWNDGNTPTGIIGTVTGNPTEILTARPTGYAPASDGTVTTRVCESITNSTSTSAVNAAGVSSYSFGSIPNRLIPVEVSRTGAYFTGLSDTTVLQLKVRFLIERVPMVQDEQIYSLSKLSPPADPGFWELYSRLAEHLPPGCMQSDNPLGEWFNNVTGLVKKYAPVVGGMVGNFVPGAAAIGNAVGKAAGFAKNMNKAAAGNQKSQAKLSGADKKSIEKQAVKKVEKDMKHKK